MHKLFKVLDFSYAFMITLFNVQKRINSFKIIIDKTNKSIILPVEFS